MRTFPALDLVWPAAPDDDVIDRVMATIDDCAPTALEPRERGVRVFFSSEWQRDHAQRTLTELADGISATPLLVPDDNWAERSQAAVTPVRVGRVVVAPPWAVPPVLNSPEHVAAAPDVVVVIMPSMGFGTGHHASTRLCLAQLQRVPLDGKTVLDVGTGSGVLAIAAAGLGARQAIGIDYDPDALFSAEENVARNGAQERVTMRAVDITREAPIGEHEILLGNLTGAMLIRHAARLIAEVTPGGSLITSGFQTEERDSVVAAFAMAGADLVDESQEDTWVAATFRRRLAGD